RMAADVLDDDGRAPGAGGRVCIGTATRGTARCPRAILRLHGHARPAARRGCRARTLLIDTRRTTGVVSLTIPALLCDSQAPWGNQVQESAVPRFWVPCVWRCDGSSALGQGPLLRIRTAGDRRSPRGDVHRLGPARGRAYGAHLRLRRGLEQAGG